MRLPYIVLQALRRLATFARLSNKALAAQLFSLLEAHATSQFSVCNSDPQHGQQRGLAGVGAKRRDVSMDMGARAVWLGAVDTRCSLATDVNPSLSLCVKMYYPCC